MHMPCPIITHLFITILFPRKSVPSCSFLTTPHDRTFLKPSTRFQLLHSLSLVLFSPPFTQSTTSSFPFRVSFTRSIFLLFFSTPRSPPICTCTQFCTEAQSYITTSPFETGTQHYLSPSFTL
uniref:Uncharacterized protein n=1 Tax=Trypanosoma vivax (strain Y486) TaxID=1055687 RepID=G0UC52_TRYVY|nr:hypothetical protein TVY486_1108840 [Trypanosoma vivax Y486]